MSCTSAVLSIPVLFLTTLLHQHTGAAEEAAGSGGEALALLEAGELGSEGGGTAAEADRQRALEAGTAAKLLRAEGDFAAAKADWEVLPAPSAHAGEEQ